MELKTIALVIIMDIFLTLQRATEENASYPLNEKHAGVLFVVAESIDEAEKKVLAFLKDNFWSGIEIREKDTLKRDAEDMPDERIKMTYQTAKKEGIAMLVYHDPIND